VNDDKDSIRQRYTQKQDSDLLIIPQNPIFTEERLMNKPLRVCAYCRVSTPNEAQTSSYELQCNYYLDYIQKQGNWIFSGIYADEGITGTNRKKRGEFNRMIVDCRAGKIDLIITKNVSRFSRNTVDCLTVVRELSGMEPRVGVFFQTENINTLHKSNEIYLAILAAFSQDESRAKSESMLWSLERRFSNKNFLCPTTTLLGYDKVDGEMVIEPEGAKTVRLIYKCSSRAIAAPILPMCSRRYADQPEKEI
jgi:DNA invertase Pin-like site-specific DNA recombinase